MREELRQIIAEVCLQVLAASVPTLFIVGVIIADKLLP